MVVDKGYKRTNLGIVLKFAEDWEIHNVGSMAELFVPMRDKPKKFASDYKLDERVSNETINDLKKLEKDRQEIKVQINKNLEELGFKT